MAKRHKCEDCGRTFRTGTAYDKHMAKVHGVMSFRGRSKVRTSCRLGHIHTSRAEADACRRKQGLSPHKRERKDKRSSEQKAVAFFLKNAGGVVVGRKRETAKALAHAEAEAARRGWSVKWEDSQESYEMGDAEDEMPREVYNAVLYDESGYVLESLSQIGDPSRLYMRVVEAELALEALSGAAR